MQPTSDFRTQIIKMITEEQDALVAYKGLCAKFQIDPNPIPEAVVKAKLQVLEMVLRNLPTSKPPIVR